MVFCGLFSSKRDAARERGRSDIYENSQKSPPEQRVSVPVNELKRLQSLEQKYLQLKKVDKKVGNLLVFKREKLTR